MAPTPKKKAKIRQSQGSTEDEGAPKEGAAAAPAATKGASKRRKGKVDEDNDVEMNDVSHAEAGGDGEEDNEGEPVLDLDMELERMDDGGIRLGPRCYIPPPPPPALTFDNDRPRLVITHIENENFKSYAGLQTLGPFHKSFTSIVGPNGSGKSNVIDSMLFVFGYRAQKIRSKKISVLIHNSEKNPNVTSCTVRVFFQEIIDDGSREGEGAGPLENDDLSYSGVPVPGSQFCVSRTAFKETEKRSAFYEINGRTCPFKEVSALLRRKGVDLDHNRFLILQGEVEQIAQMKPKGSGPNDTGMLEFLEDIIGSSRFQTPIDMLKTAVAELDELRGEKLARVKLVEKEKDELEGPRNKAIEFLRLENQVTEKKNLGYQQYIYECTQKIEKIESAKKDYEEGAATVISQVQKLTEERKEAEAAAAEAAKALEKVCGKLEEAQENFRSHELEDAKMREEMQNVNTRRKKVMHLGKMEKEKYQKLESIPESNRAKIDECNGLKDRLVRQVEEDQKKYDQAVTAINAETKVHQEEKEKLETKLIDLKKDVNEKESALTVAKSELSLLISNEEKEKARLEQLVLSKDQDTTKLANSEKRKGELERQIPEAAATAETLKKDVEELGRKEETLSTAVRRLQGAFEEKRSHLNAHKSKGRVIDALMEKKRSGEIPGIFGRLGDLGAIDKKYDVAISTAHGGGLDIILVDSVDTAKDCIEFLKRNNIGRGNFLALEKTQHFKGKVDAGRMHAPEDAPRLFDLVKSQNAKFSTAFYHCLRDTLVAENLDQANRIAYGGVRHRVVTLVGEVIDPSGAMSGGGNKRESGKMGAELTRQDTGGEDRGVQVMEEELAKAREEYQACLAKRTEKEQSLQKFSRDHETLSKELQRLTLDLRTLRERHSTFDAQIAKQKRLVVAAKTDPEMQRQLQERIDRLSEAHDKASEKAGEVDADVKRLNAKIKEVVGSRLKSINKKLDEAKGQLEKAKKEATRLEVEIKSSEREMGKSQDKLTAYEVEVKEAEAKLMELKGQRDGLEAHGKKVMDALSVLKEEEKAAMSATEKASVKIESTKKAEAKVRSQEIEINQAREKYTNELKDQTKNQAHWRREVTKLKLREIPGEEVEELKNYDEETLQEVDPKKWQIELTVMEEKMSSMKVNQAVIEEYRQKEAIYLDRVQELEEISSRKEKQRRNHEELRKLRLNEFMEGFSIITSKLKEMYQMITLGGDAELELVDSLDPFAEGIVFSVRPPNKSWKNISNLSGGEKTLSSLALVFALHYYKPTPLYVMDEIDAALDFKNVSIVANYIKERTKNAQFIIISLRSNMFELADRLVGIYKTYNCTKSATINPLLLTKGLDCEAAKN